MIKKILSPAGCITLVILLLSCPTTVDKDDKTGNPGNDKPDSTVLLLKRRTIIYETESPKKYDFIEFDKSGRLTLIHRDVRGAAPLLTKFKYDSAGRLIRLYFCNPAKPSEETGSYATFEYDAEGKRTGDKSYIASSEAPIRTGTYEYGLNTIRYIDDTREGKKVVVSEYNTAYQLIKESRYDIVGTVEKLLSYKTFLYDTKGNKVKESHFSNGDALLNEYTYEYTPDNRIIKSTEKSIKTSETKTIVYEYDEAGKMIKETITTDSSSTPEIILYTYEFY